jgi:hypothetical protein
MKNDQELTRLYFFPTHRLIKFPHLNSQSITPVPGSVFFGSDFLTVVHDFDSIIST